MNNLNKKVSLSASNLFYVDQSHSFYNESVTFLCVIQGRSQVSFRDFSGLMERGSVILLKSPCQVHMECLEKTLFLSVYFDYIFFTDHFKDDFEYLECNSVLNKNKSHTSIFSALVKLAISHTTDTEDNRFLIQHQIFELFHLLKAECVTVPEIPQSEKSNRQLTKLNQFTSYLKSNYMSPLTLQDVAGYMNYTPQYLSNFIKKQLGTTFNGYLNKFRLDSAVNYLKFRSLSVDQISFRCGFANTASFQKIFQKEYGTTPEQFRKDYHNSFSNSFLDVELFTEPAFIRDYLSNSIQPSSVISPSVIESIQQEVCDCNVADTVPLQPIWREMINLGTAANFQSPSFRGHIESMQHELHFKYGRVVNILSLVQTYYTEKRKYIFNFSRAFEVLDFMRSIHIRPFLDLGDKAPSIYLSDSDVTLGKFQEMDPVYQEMLPEFLSSCIRHYGLDEVSTWRFELWMRYLNSAMTEMESPAVYCKRFAYIYKYIKRLMPEAQIGAPGFNTYASSAILNDTLALLRAQNLVPDFISAYIYPYRPTEELAKDNRPRLYLSENPDFFRDKVTELRQICIANGMKDVPLCITEFSTHIGLYNYFNDSIYQAMFIIKQFMDNWRQVSLMGYFTASDASMEYPNNNLFLFGGNGILCKDGIKKPGYHAFGFLSMLGNELISQGQHYILTHSYDNHYQAILFNYAHFTPDYCRNFEKYELTKYPDAAFEEKLPVELIFHISGLPSGNYKIGRHMLSAEHGSVFHEWSKLNHCTDFTHMELRHFRGVCVPEMVISHQQVNDILTLSEKLYKNEICFLSIDKTL